MSPVAAQTTGRRLVGTTLTLMASTSVVTAAGSLVALGPVGPLWWALPLLAAVAASFAVSLAAAVRGADAAPAALALLVTSAAALVTAPLLVVAGVVPADPLPVGRGEGWPYFLGVAAVSACAVLLRRQPTWPAILALGVLAAALSAVRTLPPVVDPATVDPVMDTAFLAGLSVAVYSGVRGVEDVSGRVARARAAVLRADAEVEELATAEAERSRWEAAVHDDVLSALRAAAAARTPEQARRAAAAASESLEGLAAGPTTLTVSTELAVQQLRVAALGARGSTEVELSATPGSLPGRVAEALADATAELLRNTERHNGPQVRSRVQGHVSGELVRLVVADDGRGFDAGHVPEGRLGIRVSVVGRLRSVGGTADVATAPGRGTSVQLRWPR